jgi:hypothetical protein
VHRRQFLIRSSAAAAAGLLVGRAAPGFAQTPGRLSPTDHWGTPRASQLQPGRLLAHADLHNHTLFSDGDGTPGDAFESMRLANLDIACITDHSTGAALLAPAGDALAAGGCGECSTVTGLTEQEWTRLAEIADSYDPADGFLAMRGFEWSASVPETGHMNVWFSSRWTDPLRTAHAGTSGGAQFAGAGLADDIGANAGPLQEHFGEAGHLLASEGSALEAQNPLNAAAMAGMYQWLKRDPSTPLLEGGADGLVGFNHPGREPGRYGNFSFDPTVRDSVVSIEVFNRGEDYLFEGLEHDRPSPIVQCLGAGWKVGLNGVTDEHGTNWGHPRDKGRCGIWLSDFSRAGVRQAMLERRFFATDRRGFRLDVQVSDVETGATALMGQDLVSTGRAVRISVDLDGNDPEGIDSYRGRTVNVQVCTRGDLVPTVVGTFPVTVPIEGGVVPLPAVLDLGESPYVFLRICDPQRPEDGRAALPVTGGAFSGVGGAIAYASPVFLNQR